MTAGTERSLGMAIAILGVVVLVVAVVVLDGTERGSSPVPRSSSWYAAPG
jgi:hypothetical protein